MIALGLFLSVALPLLAGIPWILRTGGERSGAGSWPLALAYGYAFGLLVAVFGLRILDAVRIPAGFFTAMLVPVIVGAVGWWMNRRATPGTASPRSAPGDGWPSMQRGSRVVVVLLLLLIGLRLATLGSEILFRPIFPWEAVSAVAAKARVWYESGAMPAFVTPQQWLEGAGAYTDADSGAFALPSLLLVFTAHMMTQWHEGAVAFPWWMLGLVMVLALYGHLRRAGTGIPFALATAYIFVSLPLVDLHIGLAGAPQWIAATGVGLAGCAMLAWQDEKSGNWLWLAGIGVVLALGTLVSTWPWVALFVIAGMLDRFPVHARKITIGVPLLVLFALLAWQQTPMSVGGNKVQLQVVPGWGETIESLFLLDNWHLLYGSAILVAIAAWKWIFGARWMSRTWTIAMGLVILFVWGVVSVPGLWFGGLRDFSYAALQFAPMLVLWTALVAHALSAREPEAVPAMAAASPPISPVVPGGPFPASPAYPVPPASSASPAPPMAPLPSVPTMAAEAGEPASVTTGDPSPSAPAPASASVIVPDEPSYVSTPAPGAAAAPGAAPAPTSLPIPPSSRG